MYKALLVLAALAFLLLSPYVNAQTPSVLCWQTETTTTPPRTNCAPGLVPVATTTSASSLVLKTSLGYLTSLHVSNLSAVAGFAMLIDAAAVPSDGAVAPVACKAIAANGSASFDFSAGPALGFTNGLIAVVSSAGTCYTKTTSGGLGAYMSGIVQ